jgi:hypothetical protein
MDPHGFGHDRARDAEKGGADMGAIAVFEMLQHLPPESRLAVTQVLDEISRPLSPRELDEAFRRVGFSRAQRKACTFALKGLDIIAVVKADAS